MDVLVLNESTLLTDIAAYQISWACDYQLRFHFGRSGWRSDMRAIYVPGGSAARIPVGSAVLHLVDTISVASALGFHDEDGNEVPYGRVGVKTAQQNGQPPSEVASHECLEIAGDPNVNITAADGGLTRLYAFEMCDACQGNGYDVGAPEGRTTGVIVADFLLPSYFDPHTAPSAITDFRGALRGPFALGPKGYFSYLDLANVAAGWQQKRGAERTLPINPHGRTAQRAGAIPTA